VSGGLYAAHNKNDFSFLHIGIYPRTNDDDDEELVVKRLNDSDYRKLVQSLNVEQKDFFYHVLNSVKTDKLPMRLFLSGGARV
jgi:hypothetical protein